MRHTVLGVLALMPMVSGAQTARLEGDSQPRVVVTASRTATVVPDRAAIYVVVEGSAESSAEAAQRAERKLQALTEGVRQLGGRAEMVSALPYGVTLASQVGYPGGSSSNPYLARILIRVQVARLEQLMSVSSMLLSAGASATSAPAFESSAADSIHRAKAVEALGQARADAEALAAGLGMRLGALVEVSHYGGSAPQTRSSYVNFGRGFESLSRQAPELIVTASVSVRYSLRPR